MNDDRKYVLNLLNKYKTCYEDEEKNRIKIIDFVKNNKDCFLRSNLSGHITASAWLLSPDKDEILLTHHKKINKWIQLGGHADGEFDVLKVALNEAREESGITDIIFLSDEIFDLDIHFIPKFNEVPAHYHYDIRFLLNALNKNYIVSHESYDLAWVKIKALSLEQTQNSLRRMALKSLP